MTSIADLIVSHISTNWSGDVTPKPKIMKVIEAPIEKTLGESVLVEVLGSRDEPLNEEYANEFTSAVIRIYTNKGDTRLADLGNEVTRIFSNFTVGGFDQNILRTMNDVSERQRQSGVQIKTIELLRLSVYRGTPITGTPPTYEDIRDATFVTVDSETSILPYSQQHVNIQEANKHTPKQHELGGDRHLQTQPLVLSQSLTVQSNAIITGDLTVQGTQTSVESTTTQIKDNVITLNKGEIGAGITLGLGGIEVDRGSLSYAQILFDETNDRFVFRYGDASLVPIYTSSHLVRDIDATPVGDILLKVVDQELRVRNSADNAYALLDPLSLKIGGSIVIDSTKKVFPGAGTYGLTSGGLVADNKVADSDKWDSYHFNDYLDQAVKTTSGPVFDSPTLKVDSVNHRVGIGAIDPAYKLEVRGSVPYFVVSDTGGAKVGMVADGNSYGWIGAITNHPLLFMIGTSEKMRLDTSGNLKIGTYYLSPTGLVANDKIADSDKLDGYHLDQEVKTGSSPSFANITVGVYLVPSVSDGGYVGTSSTYWFKSYTNHIYYKDQQLFDALDDLAIIKNMKPRKDTPELIDNSTIPSPITETNEKGEHLIHMGNMVGLLTGAIKQLLIKVEDLQKRIIST